MIVKIQRPLESTIDPAPALVYNEDRSVHFFTRFLPELALAMGSRPKIYCDVELLPAGGIRIIKEVEPQPW